MGSCYTCVRYLMFFFNFLFLLVGMAVTGLGLWIRLDKNFLKYTTTAETVSTLYMGSYVIIGIGAVIMITSFLGCCGAIAENQVMLVIFFILLTIVAVVFNIAAIWSAIAFSEIPQVEELLTINLEKGIESYFEGEDLGRHYMDIVQRDFKCCGASLGILDYPSDKRAQVTECRTYFEPCVDKMMDFMYTYIEIAIAVLFVVGSVAIIGMVFSMVLCCTLKDREAMGIAVLGFGLWLLSDKTVSKYAFTDDMKESLLSTGVTIIAIGGYMMLTSVFGFFGTFCGNQCLLVFVFLMLFPLSVGFNIAGGYLSNEYSKLEKPLVDYVITAAFEFGVENYFDPYSGVIREAMDMLQKDLGCCGATNGIVDYPPSRRDEVACSHYDEPCVDKLQKFFYTAIETTIACFFVIANVALIEQVISMSFCCVVRKQRRQVTFKD